MSQSIPPEGDARNQGGTERASRRVFLRVVALAGGVIAVAALGVAGALFMMRDPVKSTISQTQFTESTCTQSISEPPTVQPVIDSKSGLILKTTDIPSNDWRQFVYPRTGCGNVDDDTFKQFAVFHLPRDLTAPSSLAATDPMSRDQFVAFSLVCVHLWCLMSYDQSSRLIVCPCHNSDYVPGTGTYPNNPAATNQPPGMAISGPAAQGTPPNNMIPVATLEISPDGTIYVTGIVGTVGYCQQCSTSTTTTTQGRPL